MSPSTPNRAGVRQAPARVVAHRIMRSREASLVAPPSVAAVERIRHPEIVPVEVGDLFVDGAVFRDSVCQRGLVSTLCRAIEILHTGQGATRSNGPLNPLVSQFDAVFLSGGRAKEEELGTRLSELKRSIFFGAKGIFTGLTGGFDFLRTRELSGWVLDMGQFQLKLASEDRCWTFPRDFTRLRETVDVPPPEISTQRRRLREFIALKLQIALAETCRGPQALIFALPTRLADDGTPGSGGYAGLRGYREFIPDVLHLAGLPDVSAFVLNDAELAAFSARADPRLAQYRKILVLTLGFGIGAALVCRS